VVSAQGDALELRAVANRLLELHSRTANTYGHEALWEAAILLRRSAIVITRGLPPPSY
jgi:hypothetical protein